MNFIITGGAGFIGSHFTDLLTSLGHKVIVLDKITYAGTESNVYAAATLVIGDINNRELVSELFYKYKPAALFNFAAESHVCRSIDEPRPFMDSNIIGTYNLLQESRRYWKTSLGFKYIQISTDEVFGDLEAREAPFKADSRYKPNSPYAASKAAADHLVRSWHHTYGLPTIVTHCSNNYGSRQNTEKLIPKLIGQALRGENMTLHGSGINVRDWIHVSDHCRGILAAFKIGISGESYCFGGNAEYMNYDVAFKIKEITGSRSEIVFTEDRPGNDRRYAINNMRAKLTLFWSPRYTFEQGLRETIKHYRKEFECSPSSAAPAS